MASDILIVGTAAYDTLETPHGKRERVLGGSAVFASLAARYFCKPSLMSTVGDDFLEADESLLTSSGVDLSGLKKLSGEKTFHWTGSYLKDLNEATTLKTELNVLTKFDTSVPESLKKTKILFLANIDPSLQKQVLDQIGDSGFTGLDTMNFWINSRPEEIFSLFPRIDILFINEQELKSLSGEKNLWKGADKLLAGGLKRLIVKRGEYGSILMADGRVFMAPAFPLKDVVDPTGAGDSFAGSFLGSLSSKESIRFEDLREALLWGTVTASFTVEGFSVESLRKLSFDDNFKRLEVFKSLLGLK
jgi:sugar/nucleoside kinase (ribokinase family)